MTFTPLTIHRLIATGENETIEFKSGFNTEVITTLNAFANTHGGIILIGVNDQGGIKGVETGPETLKSWINEIKQKTHPSIIPDVFETDIEGKHIIILSIQQFPIKPVAFQGRYFKRVKNSNHQLAVDEISMLHLQSFNSSWDYYTNTLHTLSNISTQKVQRVIERLQSRGLTIDTDSTTFLKKKELIREDKLTNACFLLFTENDTVMTTIEMGRFKSSTNIVDNARLQTDVVNEVEMVMNFIKKHINQAIILDGNIENIIQWQYPMDAIREIILNMIIHRDYSMAFDSVIKIFDDKIEFFNPGKLPNGLTINKLISNDYISTPKNKLIANLFKEMGWIEKYGSGIQRILQSFKAAQLPTPHFEEIAGGIRVTVFGKSVVDNVTVGVVDSVVDSVVGSVVDNELKVLNLLKDNQKLSAKDLAKIIDLSPRTIQRHIRSLRTKKLIKRIGSDKSGYWEIITHTND